MHFSHYLTRGKQEDCIHLRTISIEQDEASRIRNRRGKEETINQCDNSISSNNCDHYKHKSEMFIRSKGKGLGPNFHPCSKYNSFTPSFVVFVVVLLLLQQQQHSTTTAFSPSNQQHNNSTIIIDQQYYSGAGQLSPAGTVTGSSSNNIGAHYQPAFVYGAKNRSVNFTHLIVDELTGSVYIGATNWLFQISASNLKAEYALKTGPAQQQQQQQEVNWRDCAPADCLTQLAHIEAQLLPMHHAHGLDLSIPSTNVYHNFNSNSNRRNPHHQNQNHNHNTSSSNSSYAFLAPPRSTVTNTKLSASSSSSTTAIPSTHNNNYNKILAMDPDSRQLIVCGSLSQGACRRHQLGQIANYSELIPVPVASNDEHSSSVALVVSSNQNSNPNLSNQSRQQKPIIYVGATNSRLGPYREQVPAISARYLDPAQRAMQIIERSFAESARIDISFELRDYYLVNYVHTFQHNDFIYFATIQRKSPLRQFEEWGYITRLARLCLSDLSFQSYTEITLECRQQSTFSLNNNYSNNNRKRSSPNMHINNNYINYNLLQDASLSQASSHLAQQLGIKPHSSILIGAFAQSKDHTTKSQLKSAICLYPMERIEQKFNENIHMCYNGSSKARNMNYIAGSVNDCPKAGKAGNIANFCSEPLKLNGSIPMSAQPIITYDELLITAIAGTQAPTSPLLISQPSGNSNSNNQQRLMLQQASASERQHQVLLAGTSEGSMKRIVLISDNNNQLDNLRGVEFDSVQIGDNKITTQESSVSANEQHQQQPQQQQNYQEPILADLHLTPTANPQTLADYSSSSSSPRNQFAVLATAHKLVKLRVNGCKASAISSKQSNNKTQANAVEECQACAQLQDPFCGWCATTGSCLGRDECLKAATSLTSSNANPNSNQVNYLVNWAPFNQIKCSDYQPISPQLVPIQTTSQQVLDVNIRINRNNNNQQLAHQLAQTQFLCHFDYIALLTNRTQPLPNVSGATTKALQARLNLHTSTVIIGCPLPVYSQRPSSLKQDLIRVKLSVRLIINNHNNELATSSLQQLLGMKRLSTASGTLTSGTSMVNHQEQQPDYIDQVEREFYLYDCSQYTSCGSCLSAGASLTTTRVPSSVSSPLGDIVCQWCPLSNKCTFNSSHPDLGCAASAIISTTTPTSNLNAVRGSHLMQSLDQAQANVYGTSFVHISQCSSLPPNVVAINLRDNPITTTNHQSLATAVPPSNALISSSSSASQGTQQQQANSQQDQKELLIPNNSKLSIKVPLPSLVSAQAKTTKLIKRVKFECLFEWEGAKMRLAARLVEEDEHNSVVVCQEQLFSYQEEIATSRAQLSVIQTSIINNNAAGENQNQHTVIDTLDVILYKCHLFGVNPPALTSTIGSNVNSNHLHTPLGGHQYSTVAWRLHDLFNNYQPVNQLITTQRKKRHSNNSLINTPMSLLPPPISSDCSLCSNIDRKYQCVWCNSQCQHSNQCQEQLLAAPTCPPPRIDSIHPTSGPLEGGTLITIEGSNLGSNEREIQEKISVGGEPCQLYMYSVSTRIVCKTGPSLHGQQAATVFVGNKAGVTSAHEKFHYKAVHLTDVNPRVGPVSGGTRLFLTGSNLNIGSRIQIFLDDIPCALDNQSDISNYQISCITGPNLQTNSMRITRLTLMIDNSTHFLPYPFTYQPDPIITAIEPAESFLSGGRLILISGQHLASPQSIKFIVYHEHKHNIINGTNCITQKDSLITCLTPAISPELIESLQLRPPIVANTLEQGENFLLSTTGGGGPLSNNSNNNNILSYENGGLKLKMSLYMDDVKSVRNLDEYYHHLPHYITYFEDPQLFRFTKQVVDYVAGEELVIYGENLEMKQLDQDILITVGSSQHVCTIKSIKSNMITCEPPAKIEPVYDENGHLVEAPQLPIVALIGSNLRFQVGYIQYTSKHYQTLNNVHGDANNNAIMASIYPGSNQFFRGGFVVNDNQQQQPQSSSAEGMSSPVLVVILVPSLIVIILSIGAMFVFAFSRFRQSKAEREYRRIQLQMGSLDINGQPILGLGLGGGGAGNLFDTIHINNSHHQQQKQAASVGSRALDYVGSALSGKKLFYQFNQQAPTFPQSPLTDVSSLTGNPLVHNQHIVKLSSNGTIINSTNAYNNNSNSHQHLYNSATNSNNSSQSSPNSTRNSSSNNNSEQLHIKQQQQHFKGNQQQQQQFSLLQQNNNNHSNSDKSNLLSAHNHLNHLNNNNNQTLNGSSQRRNFSWTQEAPSTIVPYAVIEACNLTLEGKNAIKEFV